MAYKYKFVAPDLGRACSFRCRGRTRFFFFCHGDCSVVSVFALLHCYVTLVTHLISFTGPLGGLKSKETLDKATLHIYVSTKCCCGFPSIAAACFAPVPASQPLSQVRFSLSSLRNLLLSGVASQIYSIQSFPLKNSGTQLLGNTLFKLNVFEGTFMRL